MNRKSRQFISKIELWAEIDKVKAKLTKFLLLYKLEAGAPSTLVGDLVIVESPVY